MSLLSNQVVVFALVLLVIDSVWLFGASAGMHRAMVQRVQGKPLQVNYAWAAGFYALATLAFSQIILPLSKGEPKKLVQYGALMGLLMYGTFDFTNKAIFLDYPSDYAIKDTLWGMFAIAAASAITVKLTEE